MANKINRRDFLALMGAGGAAAATISCGSKPNYDETWKPWLSPVDGTIPYVPRYYATATAESEGGAYHVTVVDGRVTKVDGNPDHPLNAGALTARQQSVVQDLYGAERVRKPADKDGNELTWRQANVGVRLSAQEAFDLSREANGEMEISFRARGFGSTDVWVNIGMACDTGDDCTHTVPVQITQGPWREYRVSLSCFSEAGMDLSRVSSVFELRPDADEGEIGLGDIVLASDTDAAQTCGDDR